jgi:excisionase family DNA binding protein
MHVTSLAWMLSEMGFLSGSNQLRITFRLTGGLMSNAVTKTLVSPAQRAPLLDTDELAKVLNVTSRHIRRLVAERRIPFVKVGRFVRFDPSELDVWLDQQRVEVVRRGSRAARSAGR